MYEFEKQLASAEKKLKGFVGTTDYSDKKFYERFSDEFFNYCRGGKIPERAGYDLQFLLESKNKKLKKMGDEVMEIYSSNPIAEITGTGFSDEKYTFKQIFKNFRRELNVYNKKGERKFLVSENVSFCENINLANQEKIKDDDKFCCPSCGKIHELKKLEQDCPDCQASSFITDLFPTVISCFNMKNNAVTLRDVAKKLLICSLIGMAAGIPFGIIRMISNVSSGFNRDIIFDIVSKAFLAPIQGAAVGIVAAVLIILGQLIYRNVKNAPVFEKINDTKKKLKEFMAEYDRNFSYEYFEGRLIYLVQLLIYCDEREELPVCSLEHSVRKFNIIDSVYNGSFELKNMYAADNICTIEIEISMRDIHDNGERIFCKDDTFFMKLQKNISKSTDINFEVKRAVCSECGESFDGWSNKSCPACGKEYSTENDDWVVKEFRMK